MTDPHHIPFAPCITDAWWTPEVNMLLIFCPACFSEFRARADRWKPRCACGRVYSMAELRERFPEGFRVESMMKYIPDKGPWDVS